MTWHIQKDVAKRAITSPSAEAARAYNRKHFKYPKNGKRNYRK